MFVETPRYLRATERQPGGMATRAAVLYHYPCPDGAFAALAAHLYHSKLRLPVAFFPNTVYTPIQVKDLDMSSFDTFYLLDYVGPEDFASELCTKAKEVIILDHHKTASEIFSTKYAELVNLRKNINMNKSGATIAYEYFSSKLQSYSRSKLEADDRLESSHDEESTLVAHKELSRIISLFNYIEDADLWRWKLPNSKQFSSGLASLNIDYNINTNSQLFNQLLSLNPSEVIKCGEKAVVENQGLIDAAINNCFILNLGAGNFGQCLAVQDDDVADLRSELGNQLADKSRASGLRAIGAVIYRVPEVDPSILKVSLRSIEGEDTTEISQAYGGGGHRAASSFMIRREDLDKWRA